MTTITLYTNKMSRGRMVQWMLEELGEPFDVQYIEYGAAMKSADYLQINPMGKVPALKHGDAVITETPAILTYLADEYPEKGLIPPHGSPARAPFYRWLFFTAGPLEAVTMTQFLGMTPPELSPFGNPSSGALGYGTLELALTTVENHLKKNTWVCGDQFTAADIYLASHLSAGCGMFNAYPPRPVFDDYIQRAVSRPAKLRVDVV